MKTIIISALIASASLTGAASAGVGSGAAAAAAFFNQDIDTANNRANLNEGTDRVVVSTRNGILGGVFERFNADYDTQDDVRGLVGATVVPGAAAYGSDIFAQIKAEGLQDE